MVGVLEMCSTDSPLAYRPKLDFMVVGTQKGGTTALGEYLRAHPQVGMLHEEDGHVFDAPDFCPQWSPQQIDARYEDALRRCEGASIFGEASPIYMFMPEIAPALQRYNPALKLIVLLRDRVQRAISHYYMERARANEHAPLWWAILAEPWRIRRCEHPRQRRSALRVCSYRRRGLYSLQIRNLLRHFPRDQLHVIYSSDLLQDYRIVIPRLFSFLNVNPDVPIQRRTSRIGSYPKNRHRFVSFLLHSSYVIERRRSTLLQLR